MIYGDWEAAYERLPAMLNAMKASNPGMHYEYLPKQGETRDGRQVFGRAFWTFGQCIEAFKHCRPVLAIDGTFLTGKYNGTLLVAIGIDNEDMLVPLAFALVSKEDTDSWSWFLGLVRRLIVGTNREVCMISDRHAGILNAVEAQLEGYGRMHHRWCTRHLAQNLLRKDGKQEHFKLFEEVCRQREKRDFHRKLDDLMLRTNDEGRSFLDGLMASKEKWSLAYDGGVRWGFMTSNFAEIMNSLLRGCRSLPVTAIAAFTFYRCNQWFVQRFHRATALFDKGEEWPKHVDDTIGHSKNKSKRQTATCFDRSSGTYEILEAGGTNAGGEDRHARKHKVVITANTCTCQKPTLLHIACSHMHTACRVRRVDPLVPPRTAKEFGLRYLMNTWAPRFEPFRDEEEWPTYEGPRFVADRSLLHKSKGPRRRKRFAMDMDRAAKGKSTRRVVGSHFVEDTQANRCSLCHKEQHNKRKCPLAQRCQVIHNLKRNLLFLVLVCNLFLFHYPYIL